MPITIKIPPEQLAKMKASLTDLDISLSEIQQRIAADPTLLDREPIKFPDFNVTFAWMFKDGHYTPIDTGTLRRTLKSDAHARIVRHHLIAKLRRLLEEEETPCDDS